LDVTTLRDMHVGLPQGSYGFLFRGQRLMHLEEQSSEHGWNDNYGGADMLAVSTFASAAAAAVSSSTSPTTLSSFLLHPSQCTPQPQEQRDFLCAVPTLEEAQMWVIALQWAASQVNSSGSVSTEPWWPAESDDWELATTPSASPSLGLPSAASEEGEASIFRRRAVIPDASSSAPVSSNVNVAPKLEATNTESTSSAAQVSTKPGKVVVARVVDYRLVRVKNSPISSSSFLLGWLGLTFDIAFEIHALLIQNQDVEQLTLLRTARDLSILLQTLPSSPLRLVRLCQQLPRDGRDLDKNVSVVDSIVRSLVLDAGFVNTTAMKEFLGLTAATVDTNCSLWHLHDSRAVLCRSTTKLTTSAEDFVRKWLQDRNHRSTKGDSWAFKLYQLACSVNVNRSNQRQIFFTMTTLGISVVAIPYCAVQVWNSMPRISVRLDALVGSWVTAAYLGRLYDRREQHAQPVTPTKFSSSNAKKRRAAQLPVPASGAKAPVSHAVEPEMLLEGGQTATESLLDEDEEESDGEEASDDDYKDNLELQQGKLSSPLPEYPANQGKSCWSMPRNDIFYVRGPTYLHDKVKIPSDPGPLSCRGVDVWITDNPERHIARHPSVLGGRLGDEDTFLVNFLLPFGNFVSYFSIPPLEKFPSKLRTVWTSFLKGDQQYRDARLKLLPVVMDGPWIVKTAVGGGKSPALLGKAIPIQYFFRDADECGKGVYEVDVIITASAIAKGILSVVKGHTKSVSIAFAIIIEASQVDELPETVLCSFQVHSLHLEECPILPECNLEEVR
jgi:hypothetical protein